MLTFPLKNNLFNSFPDLANSLNLARNESEIDEIELRVAEYRAQHSGIAHFFVSFDDLTDDMKPSYYQEELYRAEEKILLLLSVISNRKRKELNIIIDEEEYEKSFDELRELALEYQDNPYSLIRIIYFYITIQIGMLTIIEFLCHPPPEEEHEIIVLTVFNIIDRLYQYQYLIESLKYENTQNLSEAYFHYLRSGISCMLVEGKPQDSCGTYAIYHSSKFIRALFKFRENLEKNNCFKLDAMISRFNLFNFPEYRDKYSENIALYQKLLFRIAADPKPRQTITVISGLIEYKNNIDYYNNALLILIKQVTKCELLFTAIQLLSDKNVSLNKIKTALNCSLNNILFDCKLLLSELTAKSANTPDDEVNSAKFIFQQIARVAAGILYLINPENSALYYQVFSNFSVKSIYFEFIENSSISCGLVLILQALTQKKLQGATTLEERASIFNNIILDIEFLIQRMIEANANLNEKSKEMSRQLILDYYFSCVAFCQSQSEYESLTTIKLQSRLNVLMKNLNNISVYQFISKFVAASNSLNGIYDQLGAVPAKFSAELISDLLVYSANKLTTIDKPATKINSTVYFYFLTNCKNLLMFIMNSQYSDKILLAKCLIFITDGYYNTVYSRAKELLREVSDNKSAFAPIKLINTKASFTLEFDKVKKANPTINKRRNKDKVRASGSGKDILKFDAPFEITCEHFHHKRDKIISFYQSCFDTYVPAEKIYGLLGLAECTNLITNIEKRATLGSRLCAAKEGILKAKDLSAINAVTLQKIEARLDVLLKSWECPVSPILPPTSITVNPKPVSQPILVKEVAITPQVKRRPYISLIAKTSIFNNRCETKDALRKPQPQPDKVCEESHDIFFGMRITCECKISFTSAQEKIMLLLDKEGLYPLIHGGAVVDTLFSIPYRDVDLLCFSEVNSLQTLLLSNKIALNIQSIRQNKNSNVIVIIFNAVNGFESEELEVAYLSGSNSNRAEQLRELARRYGINMTLYYDPILKSIIDPLHQYQRITKERVLDVAQVLSVNLCSYFSEHPNRMLDCIYKIAKYGKNHIEVKITEDVQDSITKNKAALQVDEKNRFHLSQFDKLFLTGCATEAFELIYRKFQLVKQIFPMLSDEHVATLNEACQYLDALVMQQSRVPITKLQLTTNRALFIEKALFPSFVSTYKLNELHNDRQLFYINCNKFVSRLIFYIDDEIINIVQDLWWEKILHQAQQYNPRSFNL
jgi:hypothetical protein